MLNDWQECGADGSTEVKVPHRLSEEAVTHIDGSQRWGALNVRWGRFSIVLDQAMVPFSAASSGNNAAHEERTFSINNDKMTSKKALAKTTLPKTT